MNASDSAIRNLLDRARQGDREALGDLLDRFRGVLKDVALRSMDGRLAGRLDASDLVQQTCLSVHRKIAEFEGQDAAQFVAWLRQIHERNIQNAARDQLHAHKRDAGLEEPLAGREVRDSQQTSPSQRAIRGEEADKLSQVLSSLPDDEREALRLRYLEGRSLDEVSRHMGITKGALVWLMRRAMDRVRSSLPELRP